MFGGPSFKLGTVLGFRIGAHWTLPVALILAGVSYGGLFGVAFSALLFVSILAHELGHAVVARRRGVPIAGIDLHMFGGVAKMAAPPRSPNDEIAIAVAGPIVSLALAGGLFGLAAVLPWSILSWLAGANLMLGVFNMLPALPLDGGRVLRAVLAKRRGLLGGTITAVKVSRVISVVLGVAALATGNFTGALLAALVWMMAGAERQQVEQSAVLSRFGFGDPNGWDRYDDDARDRVGRPRERVLVPDTVWRR